MEYTRGALVSRSQGLLLHAKKSFLANLIRLHCKIASRLMRIPEKLAKIAFDELLDVSGA